MIGLLRKDLFVADKSSRLLLVLAVVFSASPSLGNFGNTYAMLMAIMLPLNSIAYDEQCKWDRYAAMLPYRASQIVWSKYVFSGMYTLLGEAIILCGALIRNAMKPGSVDWTDTLMTAAMLGIVMLLVIAAALPAIYRFGSEKGRLVMFLIMGAGVGAAFAVAQVVLGDQRIVLPPVQVLAALGAAIVVAAVFFSFRLSVYFYKKRLNGKYA